LQHHSFAFFQCGEDVGGIGAWGLLGHNEKVLRPLHKRVGVFVTKIGVAPVDGNEYHAMRRGKTFVKFLQVFGFGSTKIMLVCIGMCDGFKSVGELFAVFKVVVLLHNKVVFATKKGRINRNGKDKKNALPELAERF
jgi:hypothetical protein